MKRAVNSNIDNDNNENLEFDENFEAENLQDPDNPVYKTTSMRKPCSPN